MEDGSVLTDSGDDDDDDERIRKLLLWAKSRNIWIHDEALVGRMTKAHFDHVKHVDISDRSGTPENGSDKDDEEGYVREERARGVGFSVSVRKGKRILERQVVVLVPKSSLLSIRTTSLNPHIPTNLIFSREATSGTLLTLILMHEMMLGKMGPWWGYLQSLPCNNGHWGIPLPMSLKKDSKEWKFVSQSEAGRMIKRAEADPMGRIEGFGMSLPRLHHFFKTKGLPILKKAHVHLLSVQSKDREKALFQDFVRAHSIISSRTFIVDMYHGMCLVPIADMFNHSEHANVHFEADDEVCDDCGSLGACPHNDDPLPSEAYGRPSSILPAETGPNSKDWIPPIQLVGVDMVEMVAQRELDCEEEAYNTYGNFSNATLLTTYGFCLEYETEWERYVWEWRYKEERDELLDAVSYSSMLRTTRNSEGEGFQQEQRSKWVKVCSQFCNLPQTSFSELLDDSYAIRQASFSKVEEKIGLPISSPFVPLTQSSKQEGEEMTLNGKLENVIAPLSTHDGSKDMYQPLFIDSQGRISTSLWRFALLWTISVERDGKDFVNGTELVRRCVQATEELLDSVLEGGQSQFQKDSDYRILQKTLLILQKLIESRLKAIEASRQMYSEIDNLSMLETMEPGLMRSTVLQSFQETTALTACTSWLVKAVEITTRARNTRESGPSKST